MNEYIIINKTEILKTIEELKKICNEPLNTIETHVGSDMNIIILKEILSQSIPLIPEIEKSLIYGSNAPICEEHTLDEIFDIACKHRHDYISNLKLNI